MFLVAITKQKISDCLGAVNIQEHEVNSYIATVATDAFLSKCIEQSNGFSVIESPLMASSDFQNIIFSEIRCNTDDNTLAIFKSTMSGRPIFYYINPQGDFFCSTHISMLRAAGVPIEENTSVVPEFFMYRYVMPPQTMYKNIKQLSVGSRLHIKLTAVGCRISGLDKYNPYTLNHQEDYEKNAVERTFALLDESIQQLSPRKDRISVLFSGGTDSSILFKLCHRNYGLNTTFSTGYPFEEEATNKEKHYALSAAKHFNTDHHYYETSNYQYLRSFIETIASVELPMHHMQSAMFNLIFRDAIPRDKNIVISGEGSEGPVGYPEVHDKMQNYENKLFYKLLAMKPFLKLFGLATKLTGRMEGRYYPFKSFVDGRGVPFDDPRHMIWHMSSYSDADWVTRYFNVPKTAIIKGRYEAVKTFNDKSTLDMLSLLCLYGEDAVSESIWSKVGEKHNKILYYPFSYNPLIDYAYSIRWDLKIKTPKNILRHIARQLGIPEFILTRRKLGFGVTFRRWALEGGVFEPLVPLAAKVFDQDEIRAMQSSKRVKAWTYWNILNYSIWKRLCINNKPVEVLLGELEESYGRSSQANRR